ncbi:hypothetical protein FCM35_KLT21528 [Carex littledalei]|uniref:Uncharacterized protein n=1 Tax=Carex littledalei TaxID=544730 RepID=A0A833RGU2_9POAL|nr:hypothetical protein FCM35_KLT21528 [Carex littledalei]
MPCPTRVLTLVAVYYHDPSIAVIPFEPQNDLIDEVIDDLAVLTMVDRRQEGHLTPEITAMPIPSTARLAVVGKSPTGMRELET